MFVLAAVLWIIWLGWIIHLWSILDAALWKPRGGLGLMPAFHFAFFVRDLASTRRFYGEILGCREGRSTETWVDFDFFGNQISAHTTGTVTPTQNTGKVEDILVPMPHFGALLGWDEFAAVAGRIREAGHAVHPRAAHPLPRTAGRAGDDVSPRSQRQRPRVQELQASRARLHRMTTGGRCAVYRRRRDRARAWPTIWPRADGATW